MLPLSLLLLQLLLPALALPQSNCLSCWPFLLLLLLLLHVCWWPGPSPQAP
jgi:hypothetical protein